MYWSRNQIKYKLIVHHQYILQTSRKCTSLNTKPTNNKRKYHLHQMNMVHHHWHPQFYHNYLQLRCHHLTMVHQQVLPLSHQHNLQILMHHQFHKIHTYPHNHPHHHFQMPLRFLNHVHQPHHQVIMAHHSTKNAIFILKNSTKLFYV